MIISDFFKIGVKDIDKKMGISNTTILEIFENIGGYHSDIIGYGVLDIPKTNRSWILLEWELKVIKRPKYGEKIEAKTWARNCSKFFTYRDFELYNESGEKLAIATSKWTWVEATTGKMTKMEKDIGLKYGAEEHHVFPENEISKITEPKKYEITQEYIASRRDIDINNHIHNIYYLSIAEEILPEEVYQNKPYNNLRITYKRGIKLRRKSTFKIRKIRQ